MQPRPMTEREKESLRAEWTRLHSGPYPQARFLSLPGQDEPIEFFHWRILKWLMLLATLAKLVIWGLGLDG